SVFATAWHGTCANGYKVRHSTNPVSHKSLTVCGGRAGAPVFSDQLALEDPLRWPLRQRRIPNFDAPGVRERREPLRAVSWQLGLGRVGSILEKGHGLDLFAEFFVLDPYHGCFGHGWMLVQQFFDFARVDVVATAEDHVLLTADDVQITVFVEVANIARVEPA